MSCNFSLLTSLSPLMADTVGSGLPSLSACLADMFLKGLVLLAAVAVLTKLLHRASAAQRFIVCQSGLIFLLLLPVYSIVVPQWQVLPDWFSTKSLSEVQNQNIVVERSRQSDATKFGESNLSKIPTWSPSDGETESGSRSNQFSKPKGVDHGARADQPPIRVSTLFLSLASKFLILTWSLGTGLLLIRLIVGAFLLRHIERDGPTWALLPGSGNRDVKTDTAGIPESILKAWESSSAQSGVNCKVILMLRSGNVIPSVWGLLRPRLLLPDESRNWSPQRLQCVMAHELAHINRRDAMGQWISQIACALHWMNPLVWLIARSMQMLREQATDDAVLATGIQSSTYARQLVELVDSQKRRRPLLLAELAMFERFALNERINAILSSDRNRTRVSSGFAMTILLLCALIAIPVSAARVTGSGNSIPGTALSLSLPASPTPNPASTEDVGPASELFELWLTMRRYPDEMLPGGLVGHLAEHVDSFLESQKADEQTLHATRQVRSVMDPDRDWMPVEARALLQQLSSVSDLPIANAVLDIRTLLDSDVTPGQNWHPILEKMNWGQPAAHGLRTAWQIDNTRTEYFAGSTVEGTVYVHNSGPEPVAFVIAQSLAHVDAETKAHDASGNPIAIKAAPEKNGSLRSRTFLLQPNQYGYATTQPIAIGKAPVGREHLGVINAWPGEVTMVSMNVPTDRVENKLACNSLGVQEARRQLIAKRVMLAGPLPKSIKQRQGLVIRLTSAILGRPASNDEVENFAKDADPDALKKLADRLASEPGLELFRGKMPTGELSLNVVKRDPSAELIELRELLSEMKAADARRRQELLEAYKAGDQPAMTSIMSEPHPAKAERLMLLAERNPETEDAFEASMLILKTTYQSERDIAAGILFDHHVESSRLDEVMDHLSYTFRAVDWAKKVLQSNRNRNVIAHAKYRLAASTEKDGRLDQTQVVANYRDLVINYGDVPFRHGYWGIPQEELPPDSPYRKPATIGAMAMHALGRLNAYQQIKKGAAIPSFSGIDLDDQPISLDDYRGKAVLVVYWTSWCGPCLVNAEMEQRLLKRYAGQPFDILGICGDEEITEEVKRTATRHGMTWRSIKNNLPDGTKLSEQFGFPSLPYVLLIDRDGIIRETEFVIGITSDPESQELQFQSAIEELLPDFKR